MCQSTRTITHAAPLHLAMIAGLTLGLGLGLPFPQSAWADGPDSNNLPISSITLYRSGVGSFIRQGQVKGDADVSLRFRTEQINDILKSMVVLDFDGGSIEGATYGSKEPLSRRLASFAVNIADNPSRSELLDRLRGAKVEVTTTESPITGVVLGVENTVHILPDGAGSEPHHVLSLVTDSGIWSADMQTISSFKILDEQLAAELNKALMALAEHRVDNVKTLDIAFRGDGTRDVMVGYVQEAPVWKTSYRLVLPTDMESDELTLQGWAIVENTTEEDWENVKLSLVSGQPISFTMDLYEPLFVQRPDVPVPTGAGAKPRSYAAGTDARLALQMPASAKQMKSNRSDRKEDSLQERYSAPARGVSALADKSYDMAASMQSSVSAAASGEDIGEVFQFTLDMPVTVDRQQSAMLPIIAGNIKGDRVSIFNANDGIKHPMRGIELVNDTGLQLMPGPISVYDGKTYAGDAQIGHVARSDERLLAYAVDLDVDAQVQQNSTSSIMSIRIVHGLIEQRYKDVRVDTYAFESHDQLRDRTLLIEQPKINQWKLVNSPKPKEIAGNLYRFELPLGANDKSRLAITQEHIRYDSVTLLNYNLSTLMMYAKTGKVSDNVINAFKEAQQLQDLVNQAKQTLAELEKERNDINQDQKRIRSNMGSIDRNSKLYATYMQKLTTQEKRLEEITVNIATATKDRDTRQRNLDEYIHELNVE